MTHFQAFLSSIWIFFVLFNVSLSEISESEELRFGMNCENGVCFRKEDDVPCTDEYHDKPKLFRWEPIKVKL